MTLVNALQAERPVDEDGAALVNLLKAIREAKREPRPVVQRQQRQVEPDRAKDWDQWVGLGERPAQSDFKRVVEQELWVSLLVLGVALAVIVAVLWAVVTSH